MKGPVPLLGIGLSYVLRRADLGHLTSKAELADELREHGATPEEADAAADAVKATLADPGRLDRLEATADEFEEHAAALKTHANELNAFVGRRNQNRETSDDHSKNRPAQG